MNVEGKPMRTIWRESSGKIVGIIDQTRLPHEFVTQEIATVDAMAEAIRAMRVRGAPLIGAAAAYGVALALERDPGDGNLNAAMKLLAATRPTAVNLRWALEEMCGVVASLVPERRAAAAWARAGEIADADVALNRRIGEHGLALLDEAWARKNRRGRLNVLTHCNAGWLACVDWGTATSPIYQAHDAGIPMHVWVDETRPRNQGASLTAFELGSHGVPHTIVVDNAGGHLMQHGLVDLVIVGTDRVAANGDVANKIGTYLKALAAEDNGVPFYVALPHSTIDWTLDSGAAIPIEERSADEVLKMPGRLPDGSVVTVEIAAPGSPAGNPAFDVTPARLVTGFVTERGVCPASREGLVSLYPERGEK